MIISVSFFIFLQLGITYFLQRDNQEKTQNIHCAHTLAACRDIEVQNSTKFVDLEVYISVE